MSIKSTRRAFLQQLAATGMLAAFPAAETLKAGTTKPGKKLRHAFIGVGNMGYADVQALSSHPDLEVVAMCDVDADRLNNAAAMFEGVRTYKDWRVMLKEEAENLDSVNISTPDHNHAIITISALRAGLHVYCQKPLAHDIYECRVVAEEAARHPHLVTQMGIQAHSFVQYQMFDDFIKTGVMGKVKEVHSWCQKSWVGPPKRRPNKVDPVPERLDWDLWLGTAKERPYVEGLYHQIKWRRWIDFGTGTQGDMGCHIIDPIFTALELTAPTKVKSLLTPPYEETYSPNNVIEHEFEGTKYTTDKMKLVWYDSWKDEDDHRPNCHDLGVDPKGHWPTQGSVLVGTKRNVLLHHISVPRILPWDDEAKDIMREFKKNHKYKHISHHHQFVDACLGKGKVTTPFDYGGRLTEAVLMGCIANRFPGKTLEWNAKDLKFTNCPEANKFLKRTYREGWDLTKMI